MFLPRFLDDNVDSTDVLDLPLPRALLFGVAVVVGSDLTGVFAFVGVFLAGVLAFAGVRLAAAAGVLALVDLAVALVMVMAMDDEGGGGGGGWLGGRTADLGGRVEYQLT